MSGCRRIFGARSIAHDRFLSRDRRERYEYARVRRDLESGAKKWGQPDFKRVNGKIR